MDTAALVTLLLPEARRVLAAFLAAHRDDAPTAVGFVFALDNVTPQLDLCTHLGPLADDEDERWNSGDYEFPAGLTGARRELGPAVWDAVVALHASARAGDRDAVYRAIVAACGEVLLDLQTEGVLPAGIDLNVAEVGDPSPVVAARGEQLRDRTRRGRTRSRS
jgi:hypothetical protein